MANTGNGPSPAQLGGGISEEWLLQQHRQQQEINARLMQGIAAIQASLQTPGPSTETASSMLDTIVGVTEGTRKPKHSLSHPNKYDGQDRAAYPAFKGYLQVKFRIDSAAIGGETEKVWYGYGYLTGKAAERIFPWLAATEKRQMPLRVDDFLAQMDAAFDDPQSVQRALEWINSEKQGSRPFRNFLQEFEQKLLEAGGWGFSDGVRKGYLRSAVSRRIKAELVAVEEPARYEDFVSQLRRTDDNLEELNRLESKRRNWIKHFSESDNSSNMDWEPTPRVSAGTASNRFRGENKPQAKWVTKEVLEQRRIDRECLRCGASDHFISECGYAPAKRPKGRDTRTGSRARLAITAGTAPTGTRRAKKEKPEAVIEESSSSFEDDSGKE
jgi:hypothetical protein